MRRCQRTTIALMVAAALWVGGCGKKKPKKVTPPDPETVWILTTGSGDARRVLGGSGIQFTDAGFVLLERDIDILKLSPTDIRAVFYDYDDATAANEDAAWLARHLRQPDPIADLRKRHDAFLAAPLPNLELENEVAAFFNRCLKESAALVALHRKHNTLFLGNSTLFLKRSMTKLQHNNAMLTPAMFREIILAVLGATEQMRYATDHQRPAIAKEWKVYLQRNILGYVRRVNQSTLPLPQKILIKDRVKKLLRQAGLLNAHRTP